MPVALPPGSVLLCPEEGEEEAGGRRQEPGEGEEAQAKGGGFQGSLPSHPYPNLP